MNGIYALEIRLNDDVCVKVGGLGEVDFKKGNYVYVGSAQRNLEKRVQRHLRKEKRLFWHIDYLLNDEHARVEKVLFKPASKSAECGLAQDLERQGDLVLGFGCSDCRCRSHLFRLTVSFSLLEQSVLAASCGWIRFAHITGL
ncbi:MAG TPA: GIY-YIG nuclease family protein [Candidatus Nanoarchaeia archaeon]|nr:GIY-YIG nuclease family protein [Candidatus Nanoarchaeia archaeon]